MTLGEIQIPASILLLALVLTAPFTIIGIWTIFKPKEKRNLGSVMI